MSGGRPINAIFALPWFTYDFTNGVVLPVTGSSPNTFAAGDDPRFGVDDAARAQAAAALEVAQAAAVASSLAKVATSGKYTDLSGRPTVGTEPGTLAAGDDGRFGVDQTARDGLAQVRSILNQLNPKGQFSNVAYSGSYKDLIDTPAIGQGPGQLAAGDDPRFGVDSTARQAAAKALQLAGSAVQGGGLAKVATSGAYGDLTGTPQVGTTAGTVAAGDDPRFGKDQTARDNASQALRVAQAAAPTSSLAKVATSGLWADLAGKPAGVPVITVAASGAAQTLTHPAMGDVCYLVTLTADTVFSITGGAVGLYQRIYLYLQQDGAGGHVPAFPAASATMQYGLDGSPPTFGSTAAGTVLGAEFATPNGTLRFCRPLT